MGKQSGRPRLPARRRRDLLIAGVRVTPDERDTILSKARSAGLKPATLMRRAALGLRVKPAVIVPDVNRRALADLAKLGGMLHQVLRAWRMQGKSQPLDVPVQYLERVRDELARVKLSLLGREPEEDE